MLFYFFLIIDLYFLIPAVTAQIFNPIVELVVPTRIPSKEGKAEIEIHPINAETKIRKCSIYFKTPETFLSFLFINSF